MTIFTPKNIFGAYKKARKSRKNKQEVYMFDQQLETRLLDMLQDLNTKKYKHGEYKKIILHDSKKRYIFSPHFKDHILHHLVYNEIYDTLDKKMVHCSFACRKGYGAHKAIYYLQKIVKKEEKRVCHYRAGHDNPVSGYSGQAGVGQEKLYYLKLDFSKFFFSINHDILKEKLKKVIYDEELLYCLFVIIDSYTSPNIYDELLVKNDFYITQKEKGLPIGGIISQILANFYLNDLDQFLKHILKVKFVRYMDDIIILGDLETLNHTKKQILDFIIKQKLILNPKKISLNLVNDGIKFVGYKIKGGKIYVGKTTKNKVNKFLDILGILDKSKFSKNDLKRINNSLQSRLGVFTHSSFGLSYFKHCHYPAGLDNPEN